MSTPTAPPSSRRGIVLFLLTGLLLLAACTAGLWFALRGSDDTSPTPADSTEPRIKGVERYEDLDRDHVTEPVDYPQHPPVGGKHDATWLNCGVYDAPVPPGNAVHSLEHGTVWIAYAKQRLSSEEIDEVSALSSRSAYTLVSPERRLEAPIVLTAWGRQLAVPSPDDERIDEFLEAYVVGPTAPEPGSPCVGGTGDPAS